jgi:vacuolar-type H+-ATPase subunit I/STV1
MSLRERIDDVRRKNSSGFMLTGSISVIVIAMLLYLAVDIAESTGYGLLTSTGVAIGTVIGGLVGFVAVLCGLYALGFVVELALELTVGAVVHISEKISRWLDR